MSAARLPAYAADLAEARQRGMTLRNRTVSVRLSGGGRPGIGYGVTVMNDTDPAELAWEWTRGLDVIVLWRDEPETRVRAAVDAIAACTPRRLLVIDVGAERVINLIRPGEDLERVRAA